MQKSSAILRYLEYNENEAEVAPSRTAMAMNGFRSNLSLSGTDAFPAMQAMDQAMKSMNANGPAQRFL